MAITKFRGEHYFLSSMYPLPHGVETRDGHVVRSIEVGYQADKWAEMPDIRRKFLNMSSGYEAKRESKKLKATLVQDTPDVLSEEKKVQSMRWYVAQKFSRNIGVAKRLVATGDEVLIEGNHWDDEFFGACLNEEGELIGRNQLGIILMEARTLLQEESPLTALNYRLGQITVAESQNWSNQIGVYPEVA